MNDLIEKLSYKIGEGFQASSLRNVENNVNLFHRKVIAYESSDLSFMTGLILTGLRGSAHIISNKLVGNHSQILHACRQHVPLVINSSHQKEALGRQTIQDNINFIKQTSAFLFIACSAQEEVYLTLIAHRASEISLIPGVVIANFPSSTDEDIRLPKDQQIVRYLGNPDDQIECPTPSQEIIFGKTRRRIPNWFSLDNPVMLGSQKSTEELAFEAAGSQKYFQGHLPELIRQAFDEFRTIFGEDIEQITALGKTSDYAVISYGAWAGRAFKDLVDSKAQFIQVNQLQPFPEELISPLLKGKKAISILEETSYNGELKTPFYAQINSFTELKTKVYSGKYVTNIEPGLLDLAIEHMVSDELQGDYYLGIPFTKNSSEYPRHQILLHEIDQKYPEITSSSIVKNGPQSKTSSIANNNIPLAIRGYKDLGPNYTKLSRFYNDTAFFYENNEQGEIVADPFAVIPAIPAATAGFINQSLNRTAIPQFDSSKCTGCGDCFIHCPHSAIPPVSIGIEQLLNAGVAIAGTKGVAIGKLTPMIKNLAKLSIKSIENGEARNVGDFLPEAFEKLVVQTKLVGEKLDSAKNEFKAVLETIGTMPVAITDTFFITPDSIEKGSGELFTLAINPSACTGCSICSEVCEEDALRMQVQTDELIQEANKQFNLWENLPDTSSETIARLHYDKDFSSMAAMMMSRNYYMVMAGASGSEKDNPSKALLHVVTASTEAVVQPKIVKQISQVDGLVDALSENIHNKLSRALPKDNLDGLSNSLRNAQGRKLSIQDVVNQVTEHEPGKLLDSKDLTRKTHLVESLKSLRWGLSEGPTGVGRSRFGILLAGENSLDWAKKYPTNNFSSPSVIHWNGSAPDQTLGLFHGHLRFLLDNIKLMRRAELESKDKYDPQIHNIEIASLEWNDLTESEKDLVPPILLVAERDDLNEAGWSSLNKLMATRYPVKVILFDHTASPRQSPVSALAQTNSGLISTIGLKNAFVFQGGMGAIDHLFSGLMDGLGKSFPAIFNLYATNPDKHSDKLGDLSPFASLALNTRAFPALRFDPDIKTNFLSGAISLDGNKFDHKDWVKEEVQISDDEWFNYEITWADWAFTQIEWSEEFREIEDDDPHLSVAEFIKLENKERADQQAVITRADKKGIKHYSVSSRVIEMTEAVLGHWNTLQEFAGLLTEFPQKLRMEVTDELRKKYESDLENIKNEYEQKLREQQAAQTETLRQQLKEKLVALSKMART